MNMADGAIGYGETEEEDMKLFDVIAKALRVGGKHVMHVVSAAHAKKHFPKRHWQAGKQALSLADFTWIPETSRYVYRDHVFKFGDKLEVFPDEFQDDGWAGIRLYTIEELEEILRQRGLEITATYGKCDTSVPASAEQIQQVVCSKKT